jgi:hypothetical protein
MSISDSLKPKMSPNLPTVGEDTSTIPRALTPDELLEVQSLIGGVGDIQDDANGTLTDEEDASEPSFFAWNDEDEDEDDDEGEDDEDEEGEDDEDEQAVKELEITGQAQKRIDSGWHTVEQGETLTSIAFRAGLLNPRIWNHDKNKDLAAKRKDPNTLLPGDAVYIPPKKPRWEAVTARKRNTFVQKNAPATLRLRLLDLGTPCGKVDYTLYVDDVECSQGTTDDKGWLTSPIPPDGRVATVECTVDDDADFPPEVFTFILGSIDPIDEESGVQRRLNDLGYDCLVTGELDDQTEEALRQFQEAYELTVTGELDDATQSKLQTLYKD